jgi:hypothetical protein
MPFNLGLLSDASISGLPEETKNQLQNQATMQMIWGALLGDPAMGFKSAQDIPTRYIATQSHLQDLATKQRQAEEIQQARDEVFPTSTTGGPRVFSQGTIGTPTGLDLGPTLQAAQRQQQELSLNPAERALRASKFIGNPNLYPQLESAIKLNAPIIKDNMAVDLSGNVLKAYPTFKDGVITQPTISGGQITGATASPVTGARQAIEQTLPFKAPEGSSLIGYTLQGLPIVKNAEGLIQAISESEAAKEGAKQEQIAKFAIEPSVNPATGETTNKSRLDIIKGLNAPPPSAPKPDLTEINKKTEALNQKIKTEGYSDENKRLFADLQTRKNAILQGQPAVVQPNISKLSPMAEAQMGEYTPILKDARKKYDAASQRKGVLDQIQNDLNNPNFDTNFLTEYKTKMLSALQSVGATSEKANSYLNSAQSARQGFANLTAANISEQAGAVSDKDIEFNKQRFAQITDTKQSVEYAIALQKAADKKSQQYYDFVSKNPVANVNQAWSESQKGQESIYEDPSLRKYLPQAPVKGGGVAHQLPSGKWVKF